MIVRQAEPKDADRIAELYAQLVNDPAVEVEQEQILALSNDERTMLYVCEYNGRVVGSALLSLCSDVMFRKQPFAVVENVIVDGAARGLGIGAAMFREIESFCLETNCSKIMLLSSAQRLDSHIFLKNRGLKAQLSVVL